MGLLDNYQTPEEQSQKPRSLLDDYGTSEKAHEAPPEGGAPQAALEGFGQTATMGYLPQLQAKFEEPINQVMNAVTGRFGSDEQIHSDPSQYVQSRDSNIARQRQQAESNPMASLAGKAAGIVPTALVGGAPASLGRATAQGAAMGAAYNPGDVAGEESPLQARDRALAALIGGGTGAAGYGVGKALTKAGDVGMQLAVGRKKYTPGVGIDLADQGLMGTRNQMAKQTQNKLADAYEQMNNAAGSAGPVDARAIGREISQEASGPLTGRGTIMASERDKPAIEAIQQFSDDVIGRGNESATQALARRRAAGSSAYSMKSGDPKQSQMAQLSKLEQQKYSQALKAADSTGRLAEADKAYSALKRAERGLSEEPSLSGLGFISRPISAVGGALPTSIASQAAIKGGQAANAATPLTLEMFLEGLRKK